MTPHSAVRTPHPDPRFRNNLSRSRDSKFFKIDLAFGEN